MQIIQSQNGGGGTPYSLPTASASTLGGVKVGTRLSIDGSGVLSADATDLSGQLHLDQTTPQTVINGYPRFNEGLLGGTDSNKTDFPKATAVFSAGDSGHTYAERVAIVGEAIGETGVQGIGIGGVAKTNGYFPGIGVFGRALATSGDAAGAVGVQGESTATHTGGSNIAFKADAQNGLLNYSFYGINGNIYNNGDITIASGKGYKITGGASTSFLKADGSLDSSTYLTSLSGAVLTSQATPQTIGDTTNRLTKLRATDITVTNTITGSVTGNAGTVTNGIYTTSQVTALAATATGDKDKYLHSNASTGALEWTTVTAGGGDFKADGSVPMTGGLQLAQGTTSLAPIKLTAGTNLTTAVSGVFEYDGTNLFFTIA